MLNLNKVNSNFLMINTSLEYHIEERITYSTIIAWCFWPSTGVNMTQLHIADTYCCLKQLPDSLFLILR